MSVANITNRLKEIAKKMEELAKKEVVIGIPSSSDSHDDITNAELGMIHEFGSPEKGIPERSFVRSTFAEEGGNAGRLMTSEVKRLLEGNASVDSVYGNVGMYMQGKMIEKITDGDFVANKEETIKRKGSATPLIDTGKLRASITYEVRNES